MVRTRIVLGAIGLVLVAAVTTLIVVLVTSIEHVDQPAWTLHMLDVGQGDALLFEVDDGTQILIDGGRDMTVLRQLSHVMPPWDRTIDILVATHPDADHIGGLVDVMERYRISTIVTSNAQKTTPVTEAFDEAAGDADLMPFREAVGLITGDIDVKTIWPVDDAFDHDANESSIVLFIDDGLYQLLLTGDIGQDVEEALLEMDLVGDVDVLKVGHHGSQHSSTQAFLQVVDPEIALISAGAENRFGHPHPGVLQRLDAIGSHVYRTDQDGMVTIERWSDGLRVRTGVDSLLPPYWTRRLIGMRRH